jgi:hypothetical protein
MATGIEGELRRSEVSQPGDRRRDGIRQGRSTLSLAEVQWGWPLIAESELVYAASVIEKCSPNGGTVRLQS